MAKNIAAFLFFMIFPCFTYVLSATYLSSTTAEIQKNHGKEETERFEERLLSLLSDEEFSIMITDVLVMAKEKIIIEEYKAGTSNEDKDLNITQLANKYNYQIEQHEVQTEDGYILTLFRLPRTGPVVFLMHGLLASADDWVTAGPASGIAYLLANAGYDVWLGNARGNKHSRRHVSLSPEANASLFWDFSWDEIGRHDLPAMIDFILLHTDQPSLKYVGHSQGTTTFFVMCSERPEYNNKMSMMVALSAVAWVSHIKSPIVRLFLEAPISLFGKYEFFPKTDMLQRALCGNEIGALVICSNLAFLIAGFDIDQLNVSNLPVLYSHTPAGAATKQVTHYLQGVRSGKFRKFDYGPLRNLLEYGSIDPPPYPVEKITTRVAIFYSDGDWLASGCDVSILKTKLPNVVEFYKIPLKTFNHLDFLWAKDVKKLVFDKLIELLK